MRYSRIMCVELHKNNERENTENSKEIQILKKRMLCVLERIAIGKGKGRKVRGVEKNEQKIVGGIQYRIKEIERERTRILI